MWKNIDFIQIYLYNKSILKYIKKDYILKNIEFNKNIEINFNSLETEKSISKINEAFCNLSKHYNEMILEKMNYNFDQYFKLLSKQLSEITIKIDTELITKQIELIFDSISASFKQTINETKEIQFTDEQLMVIENLNININNYAANDKSTKNKKFFTFDRLIAFISLLMAIITTFKPNTEATINEQQIQEIVEINNSIDETNNILQSILEQLDEATCDEVEH